MTVIEVIEKVLCDANLKGYYDLKIENVSRYPKLDYIVQYQESDLNFISRQMESNGIWYFFKQNSVSIDQIGTEHPSEKMVITDAPVNFTDIGKPDTIGYSSPSGLVQIDQNTELESISSVHQFNNIIPKDIIVKNYNYRTPDNLIIANVSNSQSANGKIFEYGGPVKNSSEANNAADLISKRLKSRQIYTKLSGNCTAFRAGYIFNLDKHFFPNFNTSHLILNVTHFGGFVDNDRSHQVYYNNSETLYGESISRYAPQKCTAVPKVNGIITAFIESDDVSYATLDSQGRYKVRFPFDLSDKKENESGSKFIRLAQPYCGTQYGFHFPSHGGTEMILACVNGDPDKPIGIGTVPNADTTSPVIDLNRFQNIIKTAGGNSLTMDDQDGKQKIELLTKRTAGLKIDDEDNQIVLTSPENNQITIDDKKRTVSIKNNSNIINLTCKEDCCVIDLSTKNGHSINIDDKNKKITINSGGGNTIAMDDNDMKITFSNGNNNTVTMDNKNGLSLDSNGKISISAAKDIEIRGENVKIVSSNGNVELQASSDMLIKARNISQQGESSINIKSNEFVTEATGKIQIKGSDIDISSQGKVKVNGEMNAELSSGVSTSVKGGVVLIN